MSLSLGAVRIPEDLQRVAEAQSGIVSRRQLRSAGVTDDAVRWALGRTARLVLPGVVALFTGQLDARQRLVAASLLGGPDAVLASVTAARWHGLLEGPDDRVVRLVVPHARAARRVGFVVVRRTTRPDPHPWSRGPITVCSPARALVDAAREMRDSRSAAAAIVAAVQRRVVRLEDLEHEVEAGPVRGSAAVRAGVLAARSGAWSLPEVDMLAVLARSSVLPRVWPNPELRTLDGARLPTPDGYIADVGLAVQVHSRTYHQRDEDWEATVESDTALGEAGVHVVGVTPTTLRDHPARFLARMERTYRSLRRSGRTVDVVMSPRGPGAV